MQLSPKEFAEKVTFLVLSFNFKTFTVKYESSCKYQVLNSISSIYLFKSCICSLVFSGIIFDFHVSKIRFKNKSIYLFKW